MDRFKFDLGEQVMIIVSGEKGVIIGRAEFASNENSYMIRYAAADNRAIESWWGESALEPV